MRQLLSLPPSPVHLFLPFLLHMDKKGIRNFIILEFCSHAAVQEAAELLKILRERERKSEKGEGGREREREGELGSEQPPSLSSGKTSGLTNTSL